MKSKEKIISMSTH